MGRFRFFGKKGRYSVAHTDMGPQKLGKVYRDEGGRWTACYTVPPKGTGVSEEREEHEFASRQDAAEFLRIMKENQRRKTRVYVLKGENSPKP